MTKILTVYINATDDTDAVPASGHISLANLLHAMTVKDDDHDSICIKGCGIDNPDKRDMGIVNSFHLEAQMNDLAANIASVANNSNEEYIVNIYGMSRGGVATYMLSQKLKVLTPNIKINIISFDPVPGNTISTVNLDRLTKQTLTQQNADLRHCNNMQNALVVFTNHPLPPQIAHAPLMPRLPETCSTIVRIVPGAHKSMSMFTKDGDEIKPFFLDAVIPFHLAVEELTKRGVEFDFEKFKLDPLLKMDSQQTCYLPSNVKLAEIYSDMQAQQPQLGKASLATLFAPNTRNMQMNTLITTNSHGLFVNRHQRSLISETPINGETFKYNIEVGNVDDSIADNAKQVLEGMRDGFKSYFGFN